MFEKTIQYKIKFKILNSIFENLKMIKNLTISQLTLNLLLYSPFVSQSTMVQKNNFNFFNKINCMRSFYSFLYSASNIFTTVKSSSFSKFQGQSPIHIDSKFDYIKSGKRTNEEGEDEGNTNYYAYGIFNSQLFFQSYVKLSVTFEQCTFLDCTSQNMQGGAICFRKEEASLIINKCLFIRCKSFKNAGAIYVIQMYNGYWVEGDVSITDSSFEECCDCDKYSSYVAGVIDAYVAKGKSNYAFLLKNTNFINCQYDQKNKITEAQIRLNANILHFNYNNFTNNDHKIDASAILFVKYIQEESTITFLNAFNQYGFSFFEIYDLESGYIQAYNINIVNTTFTNFDQGEILIKIAFFNIYFAFDDTFYIDNFYAIDFVTICTEDSDVDYELVEPVIVQIPKTCAIPRTYNIFSNKPFSVSNKIDYKIIPEMRYDYDLKIFTNMPRLEETPTPTPMASSTPSETPLETLGFFTENIQTTHFVNENDLFNSIQSNNGKTNMKAEIIVIIVVGSIVIVASIVIIVNIIMQKKKNSFQSKYLNNDENEDNSDTNDNDNSAKDDDGDNHQSENYYNHKSNFGDRANCELFYNPRNRLKQSDPSKAPTLVNTLVNEDPFKNDIEEYTQQT